MHSTCTFCFLALPNKARILLCLDSLQSTSRCPWPKATVKPPVSSSPTSGPTRHSLRGNRTRTGTATAVRSGPGSQDLGFRPSVFGSQDLGFRTSKALHPTVVLSFSPHFSLRPPSLFFFPSLFSASSGHRQKKKKKSRRGEPASAF